METTNEIRVRLTEKIKRWIRTALASDIIDDDLRCKLDKFVSKDIDGRQQITIPFSLVKCVHECIVSDQGKLRYSHYSVRQ